MGKIKIHELAKKLGLNSKDVLDKAIELGVDVKSHMSSIEEKDAKKIEEKLSNVKKEVKETKEKKETPVIIRREVIMNDNSIVKKDEKTENKSTNKGVGFIERERNKDYNIVYRNKPNKPLTVSELFGKKEEPKKEEIIPKTDVQEVKVEQKVQENNNFGNQNRNYNNRDNQNRNYGNSPI